MAFAYDRFEIRVRDIVTYSSCQQPGIQGSWRNENRFTVYASIIRLPSWRCSSAYEVLLHYWLC